MKRILSLFLSLLLLTFFFVSPLLWKNAVAYGETTVNIGTYEAFGLHAIGTNVFYSFSPKYSGSYVFQTHLPYSGEEQNTILQVYNSSEQLLASNDNWGTGPYSRIGLNLTVGSVYLVKILTYPTTLSYNCYLTVHKEGSMFYEEGEDYSISPYVNIMKDFKKKSSATTSYNCLAYALGNLNMPESEQWQWIGYPSISEVADYLADLDISQISSYSSSGKCIIAYGPSAQEITHFALSEYGSISAKLGGLECVYHSDIYQYYQYGNPVGFFLCNYDD